MTNQNVSEACAAIVAEHAARTRAMLEMDRAIKVAAEAVGLAAQLDAYAMALGGARGERGRAMSTVPRSWVSKVVGSYRDHDGHQLVVVRRLAVKRWQVCDVSQDGEERVIEVLAGDQESEQTAIAVARDYLEQATKQTKRAA